MPAWGLFRTSGESLHPRIRVFRMGHGDRRAKLLRRAADPCRRRLDRHLSRKLPRAFGRHDARGLPHSFEPAHQWRWSARSGTSRGASLHHSSRSSAGWWLAEDSATLTRLVRNVLGAALDYDQSHSSMLVPSVRSWLEHDRHGETAAKALQIHPNTLAYRLRRFEELTGRSLSSTQDITEIWLSMRASLSHDWAAT